VKYPPPDSRSEQVRLFIEKMRSKGKSGKDLDLQTVHQHLAKFSHYALMRVNIFSNGVKEAKSPPGF
jgi:hypothetical protein